MNITSSMLRKTLCDIEGAYAPSTIRAYRANFERFITFCDTLTAQALPAEPSVVARYIERLTHSNLKASSIRIAVATIATIHKLNQLPDPIQHPIIKIEMRRMHRTLGRRCSQAYGITAPILEKMVHATSNDLRGLRDRTLLLLAYDSLCRRSELVSILIQDIHYEETEETIRMKIRLRRSKTDQEQYGRWIYPNTSTANAINLWLEATKLQGGYLLRGINNAVEISKELNCGQINRIYKRLASSAGLPCSIVRQISGHSMRVGAAQDLLKSGASMPIIMNKGRWSKTDTVMRYLEGAA
jgi:site-specific recombinase XerD